MLPFNPPRYTILLGTCVIGIIISMIWKKKKKKAQIDSLENKYTVKLPVNWKKVGQISNLMMYPVKSAKATHLQKAGCAPLGLIETENPNLQLRDREFIVYDPEKKKAVSGLVNTKLTLLESKAEDKTTIRLSFPGKEDFHLKLPFDESNVIKLDRWWGEVVAAVDCGDAVAHWLSEAILGHALFGLRLGHFSRPSVPLRTLDNGWTAFANVYPRVRDEYLLDTNEVATRLVTFQQDFKNGAYSYMASYLIISESSVDDLNMRLSSPVTVSHFRANIVVSGCEAYSEDSWDWIKIGDHVVMRGFKPCTRCVIIAIDPDTGNMDPNFEPLRTLKQYRQVTDPAERELAGRGREPVFGLYAGLHVAGTVNVGDPVYVGCNGN